MFALIDSVIAKSNQLGFNQRVYDVIGIVLFVSMPGDKVVNTTTGETYETKHINVHLAGLDLTCPDCGFDEEDWFTVNPAWKQASSLEPGSLVRLKRRHFAEGEIKLKDGTALPAGARLDMADSHAWTAEQSKAILASLSKDKEVTAAERKQAKQLLKIAEELTQ